MVARHGVFSSWHDAVTWWRNHHPTRQRFSSGVEREARGNIDYDPEIVWIGIDLAIVKAMRQRDCLKRAAWYAYYRTEPRLGVDEIADVVCRNKRTVWRWLEEINDTLQGELLSRGFVEEEKENKPIDRQ
jgi:hypothetical protein